MLAAQALHYGIKSPKHSKYTAPNRPQSNLRGTAGEGNPPALPRRRDLVAGRRYRVRKASGASDVALSAASIGEPITGLNLGERDTALVHSHACVPIPKRRASPCQFERAAIAIR
jgi:hypothetical protein